MQEKIKPSNEPPHRKSWGLTSNIQPQVCHNRMAMLNRNLLPFSTQYVLCLTAWNSMHIYVRAFGPNLSPFQQIFGNKTWILSHKNNTHQAKLANQGTPGVWVGYMEGCPTGTYQIFIPKQKILFWPGRWLSYRSPTESILRLKNLS